MVALSETEVPEQDNSIVFRGYTILFPSLSANNKYRLLLLVRQDAAAQYRAKVVRTTPLEIWLELHLPCGPTLVCAIYRQWTANEEADLQAFHGNLRDFSAKYDRILVLGDVNLDWSRRGDPKYYRRKLLQEHCDCLQETQLRTANELDPSPTYKSYAMFAGPDGDRSAKESVLDHLYYTGMPPPSSGSSPLLPRTIGPSSRSSSSKTAGAASSGPPAGTSSPSTPASAGPSMRRS